MESMVSSADLPSQLLDLLSREPPEPLVIPLISLDDRGRPHASLVSCSELLVMGNSLYLFHGFPTSTAENLERRGVCSLLVAEPGMVVYLKARAVRLEIGEGQALFRIEVEEVREDRPGPEEADARIVTSLRFAESEEGRRKRIDRRRAWRERVFRLPSR